MTKEPCPNCIDLAAKLGAAIEALAECQRKQVAEVPVIGEVLSDGTVLIWKGKD